MNIQNRTLFIADNLDILRGIDSETIDLIYLDPPFNTNKQYKAPIGSRAEGATFKDIWTNDDVKHEWHGQIAERHQDLYQAIQASETLYDKSMRIYLTAMAIRLFEMQRILKPTGSIYLHCDPTASHYLKLMMDSLFGKQNFRNEIVWHYYNIASTSRNFLGRKHDVILFYANSKASPFNWDVMREPYSPDSNWVKAADSYGDDRYSANERGKLMHDVWRMPTLNNMAKERVGYPTQKPLALLERIIKASSNEGDVVLDPFCGCATACVAAEQLKRQWIGVDISPSAEDITKIRLQDEVDDQADLFNPYHDVHIKTEPPQRTDSTEVTIQQRLPGDHKHELYGVQEGRCKGCTHYFPFHNLTVDHIQPRSKGGSHLKTNLQLLCAYCNSVKGNRTHQELIASLKEMGILKG